MKRTDSFFYFFLMAAALLLFTHCTGNGKQTPMQVDEVMAISETLAGETVIVEGLCTHVCSKSGMKLFLQDSDQSITLRAESDATLGKFDTTCVGRQVRVRGILIKETIDETLHHDLPAEPAEIDGVDHCETEDTAAPSFHIAAISYQILN